ncbi:hypothetical protein ABXW19_12550, partial [Streptococcus suis]|uniref:hypothetical protein n=1 Tax=Streptococcus suis TaxID=1307 RepID=UPI003CF1CC31
PNAWKTIAEAIEAAVQGDAAPLYQLGGIQPCDGTAPPISIAPPESIACGDVTHIYKKLATPDDLLADL